MSGNSGSGGSGTIQFWFAVRPNIHIGLNKGFIDYFQDDGNITTTYDVDYFNLATRMYHKNKNYYYEGAIGFSRLSQRSVLNDNSSVLINSSINGFGISGGIGTSIYRGELWEFLLNGYFTYNLFEGGTKVFLIGYNLGIMLPRRNTK